MTLAISAYGTILQLSDGGGTPTFTSVAEIRAIGEVGGERDMIEVTHMESPQAAKEFICGLLDSLAASLDLNYLPADPTHKDMLANLQQTTVANVMRPYRIVFPDWGATSFTASVASGLWTASGTHGWNTAQPVVFSTTGALPTMTPAIKPGVVYWASRAGGTTFRIFPTSANAAANTGAITGGTGGSGTHTVQGGSSLSFTGAFKSAKLSGPVSDRLAIATSLKLTGRPNLTP